MTPLEQASLNQILAADPVRSAFVMANAGSGKTRVLTNRVARLLLANTSPGKILCITFTKAAAAEMAERLFEVLGAWALADDETLIEALNELEGDAAKQRDTDALNKVRRLFVRALETPGGLKIQTIHAFCEQVLRRFPLEAGAPPGFAIIEDSEARQLRDTALDGVALRAGADADIANAFTRLARGHNEKSLRELLHNRAMKRLGFDAALTRFGGLDGVLRGCAAELDINPQTTEEMLQAEFLGQLDKRELERACTALEASGANPTKFGAIPIKTFLAATTDAERWAALLPMFTKANGEPREKIASNATDKIDAWARPFVDGLREQFVTQLALLKALNIYHDTAAYLRLLSALIGAYAKMKSARAALDFDDLIKRTQHLLETTDGAWVMYKLDQGIDHILVDEAQDTSPAQWAIIEALLSEIKSGGGAGSAARSFFAVGDMKQSIYSFQGADAELFEEKEASLGKALAGVGAYQNFNLQVSFRSTAPVLEFVDALFAADGAADGLGRHGVPAHGLKREGEAGLVELWPLTPRPDTPKPNPWDAPVDAPAASAPVKVLSRKIANTIKDWLAAEQLISQGRKIAPGDIMILVQSRGPLFEEVIRQLAQAGVRVAGADRLKLVEDPAVEDLLSFAKFALLSSDDLSLAEVLKSPLYSFDDDADLFPLAHPRGPAQSLWSALNERAGEQATWRKAADEISAARTRGLREGPYAFFTHILDAGTPSGRRRFYTRLSEASRDAVDEILRQALNYENAHPRSLQGFVDWFTDNAGEIKREMERSNDAVRVMTVHGAKGLQSKIVFLLDAHRGPNIRQIGPVLDLARDSANAPARERLSLLVPSKAGDVPTTEEARAEIKRKAYEEYRRQLYVAATRAEDRLYICGLEQGNQKSPGEKVVTEKSWHALAQDAFDRLGDAVHEAGEPFWPDGEDALRRYACAQTADIKQPDSPQIPPDIASPPWLFAPAKHEAAALSLAPSRLADEEEAAADGVEKAPAHSPAHTPTASDRYFRGRTLHRLLELLPDVEAGARSAAGDRLLARIAPQIEPDERARWRDEILTVLNDPQFAAVFGAGSRAEVNIAGAPKGAKPGLIISGQIDRLVVGVDEILVIDYKTNRPPPKDVADASPAYVAQMAAYRALLQEIYPAHKIKSALLWTFEARLMALPDAMLDHAFARTLAAG
jgi:ATP-dependent helicase/nuclease subunit A